MTSAKIRSITKFFGADVQTSSEFSVALKPINLKILPAGTIYSTSHPRKWIQIQIWTDGPNFNLHFKSLASPLRRRPWKWRFPEHRITLRVRMCPSCSTSHLKYWNDLEKAKSKLPELKKRLPSKIGRLSFFWAPMWDLGTKFQPRRKL